MFRKWWHVSYTYVFGSTSERVECEGFAVSASSPELAIEDIRYRFEEQGLEIIKATAKKKRKFLWIFGETEAEIAGSWTKDDSSGQSI